MDDIEIVDYDPRWPQEFEAEALRLWDVLPKELVLGIEHIGSTAVPGLSDYMRHINFQKQPCWIG